MTLTAPTRSEVPADPGLTTPHAVPLTPNPTSPPPQVFGSPMGPGGGSSSTPLLPGVAGAGSGMSSPQFLAQPPFAEPAPTKGYVQQSVYGRGSYPGGPGFAPR